MGPMSRRGAALGLLAGLLCFALGLVAARFLVPAPQTAPVEPRIVFDPASIDLLPDASLRLDLPPGFGLDAGAAP
jgi:hypothetical protein